VAFACAFGEACTKCDAKRVQAKAVRWDFLARTRASSSRSKQLNHLSRTLEERHILLCLQETDLEVHEAILEEEQVRGLHPFNGRDVLAELEEIRTRVDGIADEARRLS
jgi:hypothetical protein